MSTTLVLGTLRSLPIRRYACAPHHPAPHLSRVAPCALPTQLCWNELSDPAQRAQENDTTALRVFETMNDVELLVRAALSSQIFVPGP